MSVSITTSADSLALRETIGSLYEYIEKQVELISDIRKRVVLKEFSKMHPTLKLNTQIIADLSPPDDSTKTYNLNNTMELIAFRLKQMKEEKKKTKREVYDAINTMKEENDCLKRRIKKLKESKYDTSIYKYNIEQQ